MEPPVTTAPGRPELRVRRSGPAAFVLAALALVIGSLGCATTSAVAGDGPGAGEPRVVVERFLRLAAEGDFAGMGRIFGTAEGPVARRDPAGELERRMYALATLLRHESAVVGEGSPVPGRGGEAIGFEVAFTRDGRVRTAPFVVVRGPGQRWFLEEVGLSALADRS